MGKAGLPVCSPAKWLSYHFLGNLNHTPSSPAGWDNMNKRLGCCSSKWERIFLSNSPSCGAGGSQEPEPCALTQAPQAHWSSTAQHLGLAAAPQAAPAVLQRRRWEIKTNHLGGQCLLLLPLVPAKFSPNVPWL